MAHCALKRLAVYVTRVSIASVCVVWQGLLFGTRGEVDVLHGVVGVKEPPPDEVIEELRDAARDADMPYWTATDNQVRLVKDGPSVGSITVMNPDSKKESVSVYCRLHQCKVPCKLARQAVLTTLRKPACCTTLL